MRSVTMPKLDLAMDRGSVGKWLKKQGEKVSENETIAEIETAKATYEMPAPVSGTLYKILVPEGVEVPVAGVLAIIVESGDDIRDVETTVEKFETAKEPEEVFEKEKILISPIARKLAEEHGIDISRIEGTGPGHRIVKEDVLKAVEELEAGVRPKESVPLETILLSGIRKTAAERLAYSHKTIPPATAAIEVDMSETNRIREDFMKSENVKMSYNPLFAKAVAKALQENPLLNSRLVENRIEIVKEINVGLAVAVQDGLIVPVIHNADKMQLTELNNLIEELIEKASARALSISEVTGGTFTISNIGMFGVESITQIIVPNQAAILGIGKITNKPVVVNGQITVKPMVCLSLTFDHRILDGVQVAQFLQKVKQYLESPKLLD